ncbi:MAG: putative glycine dehydrogenase (decarboxylating) subunit 1 [Candidatus Heimdallarchaeota archaeon LC_3]|nr:MAG: putative glycine dehydrogenase (decarboxylating) subunit 1 [Candidatus Heimdallarchaeota archaeon LC_3]
MTSQTNNHFAFRANSDEVVQSMLKELGLQSLKDLFNDIPPELKIQERPEEFPKPHSEMEAFRYLFSILSKNKSGAEFLSFLGSGLYDHYVPAVVEEIQNRSEFKTSYTPYAPEMSQGLLTALYEYQSMICELTGLEAANNSTYDWATAIGEAALMCARIKNYKSNPLFLVAQTILPERYETVLTYTEPLGISVEVIPFDPSTGQINIKNFKSLLNDNVVGVYIETPNLFGVIEEKIKEIIDITHSLDALAVIGIDPISLAVLEAPGNLNADICVGEGQALGNAPNFGGPLLGIFTSKAEKNFIRNLPGRVIGYTKTKDGSKDAYVMTLQTREQHIRREKATSNICSNEALFSVSATAYLALLGPKGLEELAHHLMGRVGYILDKLGDSAVPYHSQPLFKEILLKLPKGSYEDFKNYLLSIKVLIGKNFGSIFNNGENDVVVISVSEKHSLEDLDKLTDAIKSFLKGRVG